MSLLISRRALRASIALAALITPFGLQAAEGAQAPKAVIGAGVAYTPEYSGSEDMRTRAVIFGEYNFGNGAFISTLRGIGYAHQFDSVELSAALGYRSGRKDRDTRGTAGSDYLRGMGDIDGTATLNLGAKTKIGELGLAAGAQIAGSGEDKGNTYTLEASYPLFAGQKDRIELSGGLRYADSKYAQNWYGVTASQSLASGFSPYRAKSGVESYGAKLTWTHAIDKNWSVRTVAGVQRLAGDAADSPIVQKKTNPVFISTVNYAF